MKHSKIFSRQLALLILLATLIPPSPAAETRPTQAYLRAGEHGQALLLSRLGECYAITPKHVIGSDLFATLVGGEAGKPQGDGDLLQTFGYDLSILRVTGALATQCGGPLTDVPALDSLLSGSSAANVSSVNEDGSISRRNVTLIDVGLLYLRLRPDAGDELFKGLSGSLVLVGDRPAGILMSVDPETGEGRALRYDRAIETLRPFFGLPGVTAVATAEKSVAQAASAGLQATVVSWSSPPIGAEYRASNLVDTRDGTSVWYAVADKFPLELVIQLPGDRAHTLDALRLIGEGVEPVERLPRDFEVLVSSTGQGNWLPVSNGTYFKTEANKLVRFAPVRARQVMLRIYSHWGDSDAVGLSGIEIPSAK
jgi:hypothetical protein